MQVEHDFFSAPSFTSIRLCSTRHSPAVTAVPEAGRTLMIEMRRLSACELTPLITNDLARSREFYHISVSR